MNNTESALPIEVVNILTAKGYNLVGKHYCPSCSKRHEYWNGATNALDIITNKKSFTTGIFENGRFQQKAGITYALPQLNEVINNL